MRKKFWEYLTGAPGSLYSKSIMNNTVDNTVNPTVSIEFGLPNGSAGQAAAHSSGYLRKRLAQWAERYNVELGYSTRHHDYRFWLRVAFSKEEDLTLFALSWEEKTFMPWSRVSPEKGPVG